ncbi:unnamed protein product, partial [Rotaria socialis]
MDLDDECSWNLWKKVNNKFDLQQMSGSIDSLLTEIEESCPLFLLHTHINREQREYFSINYTLVRHCEVQQGFFSQHQVTLFTIHLTIGKEQRNVAIISDYMERTTVFAHCAQKVLTQFIKTNFPLVKKINYVSDTTEHGKGAGNGIGAVLKASARRATLSKNILMSNAKDFYEFTQKQQIETARRSNKDIPGVHAFFLESDEIEEAKTSNN